MKYTWVKYKPRYTKYDSDKLMLNKQNINLGMEAYRKMGYPKKVEIWYDIENKAFHLIASETGKTIGKNRVINASWLSRVMPNGRYDYISDGIFKFKEVERQEKSKDGVRKKTYIKINDNCMAPIILELDSAMVYLKELLEGRTLEELINITCVEMTEEEYKELSEFER